MQKTVCYFLTRNLYQNIMPSLKSLLKNGNIDQVYLMIEDDGIGESLPDNVKCINVSNQNYFRSNGPNYSKKWTYMTMMKVTVCKFFPELSRALTLDVDTIVLGDLSGLWDLDMERFTLAGVREPEWTRKYRRNYINCGVVLWNLDRMRDGRADMLIRSLNDEQYNYSEQDCVNRLLHREILPIDGAYNRCNYTEPTQRDLKILHYAARGYAYFMAQPVVMKYMRMTWDEVLRR